MKEKGTMPGLRNRGKDKRDRRTKSRRERTHKKRTKSLMLLQQDLFVMTCTTVFRNIEEEGQYTIDQNIRDKFNAKLMYEEALAQDIPWRQWNHWVRRKILNYLKTINDPQHDPQDGPVDDDEKCSLM